MTLNSVDVKYGVILEKFNICNLIFVKILQFLNEIEAKLFLVPYFDQIKFRTFHASVIFVG